MAEVLERPEIEAPAEQKLATVAVVGLGYVGLPVAVAFGKRAPDDRLRPVEEAHREPAPPRRLDRRGGDGGSAGGEAAPRDRHPAELAEADFIIVAVPTPIDAAHQPDLCAARVGERGGRRAT